MAQDNVCCGGGNDENGMLWIIHGKYTDEQARKIGTDRAMDKYCIWSPEVNEESMVKVGGGVPIPPGKNIDKNAMEKYQWLIDNSEIVYKKIGNNQFVTRRMK